MFLRFSEVPARTQGVPLPLSWRARRAARARCPYHLWTFNLEGSLASVPLEKGLKGKGGMPPCFKKENHNLRKLRVETIGGMIFATFSEETEPLVDYLGLHCESQISRLLDQRTPKVTGYMRQMIEGNWKLYNENVRDPYHASLLHLFQVSFGIQQPTMKGGITPVTSAPSTTTVT